MNTLNVSHTLANLLIKYIKLNGLTQHEALMNSLKRIQAGSLMSYKLWCDLLEDISQLSNNPQLGIELGELAEAEHGGILAYLASSCSTLGDALKHFERFQSLLYGGEARVELMAETVRICWQSDTPPCLGTQLSDEVLIIGLIYFIKRLVTPANHKDIQLVKIGFIHQQPSYAQSYERHLIRSVSFGGEELTVEFSKHHLEWSVINPEPVLKHILEQQAEVLLQQSSPANKMDTDNEFNQRLRVELKRCISESNITLDALASKMHVSSRTLHRRLQEQGKNFNQLLRDIRLELATEYLADTRLSLSEISARLGYAEQSAFSRAFKQWTNTTPKQYLKN